MAIGITGLIAISLTGFGGWSELRLLCAAEEVEMSRGVRGRSAVSHLHGWWDQAEGRCLELDPCWAF